MLVNISTIAVKWKDERIKHMKGADFSLNTFCRHLATDATVMTVQIGLMLPTLVAKPATRQHTTKKTK